MSFSAADRLFVSGAGTAAFYSTSGGGTLLGVVVNYVSGTTSISGSTVFVLDAVSGVSNSNSGTALYLWNGAAGNPPILDVPTPFTSGLVAQGAAGSTMTVSFSR